MAMITKGRDVIAIVEERTGLVGKDTEKLLELMADIIPMVVRIDDRLAVLESRVEDTLEITAETNAIVADAKVKKYIGKKPEFLPDLMEEVQKFSEKEIRNVIYRASSNQRAGYNKIYSKLCDITGINIYEAGKCRILKTDRLGFTNTGTTYINTLFKKGIEKEAAAIALDIIRNK